MPSYKNQELVSELAQSKYATRALIPSDFTLFHVVDVSRCGGLTAKNCTVIHVHMY